jgi:hypothetical protein
MNGRMNSRQQPHKVAARLNAAPAVFDRHHNRREVGRPLQGGRNDPPPTLFAEREREARGGGFARRSAETRVGPR